MTNICGEVKSNAEGVKMHMPLEIVKAFKSALYIIGQD